MAQIIIQPIGSYIAIGFSVKICNIECITASLAFFVCFHLRKEPSNVDKVFNSSFLRIVLALVTFYFIFEIIRP